MLNNIKSKIRRNRNSRKRNHHRKISTIRNRDRYYHTPLHKKTIIGMSLISAIAIFIGIALFSTISYFTYRNLWANDDKDNNKNKNELYAAENNKEDSTADMFSYLEEVNKISYDFENKSKESTVNIDEANLNEIMNKNGLNKNTNVKLGDILNELHDIEASNLGGTSNGVIPTDPSEIQPNDTSELHNGSQSDSKEHNNEPTDPKKTDVTNKKDDTESDIEGPVKPENKGIYAGKKVYLTFDDGPNIHTDTILDILDDYGVKATFFTVGKTDDRSLRLYNRIIDEGHTLGSHSYSHVYKEIYSSVKSFDKDYAKLYKLVYDTTGYEIKIYRFPGGSSNRVSKLNMKEFIKYLNSKSVHYYDWNVDSGDASGKSLTTKELVKNVLDGVASMNTSVVLLHDGLATDASIAALREILDDLTTKGAEILPITEDTTLVQHIKASSVQNED